MRAAHALARLSVTHAAWMLQVLLTQSAAKERGYADVVYLDAKTDTLLEEVSSCNIFVVKGRKIRTPALQAGPVRSCWCLVLTWRQWINALIRMSSRID